MPTYDYQCRSCGAITEVIHSMLEEGPSVCERCGGELRRVLYPAGIIFKGSGFYRTDSRNGASGSKAAGSKASSEKASSESSASSSGSAESASSGSSPASGGSTATDRGTAKKSEPASH